MEYYLIPVRIALFKYLEIEMLASMWRERWTNELFMGMQAGTSTVKPVKRHLRKPSIDFPCDPAVQMLGIIQMK